MLPNRNTLTTMKHSIFSAALLLGYLMFSACEKEDSLLAGLPEGAIRLTAEGMQGDGAKTSVEGTSVQWVGGESVRLNGNNYTVQVSGGKAYIEANLPGVELYGYYNCGIVTDGLTTTPSIYFPANFSSNASGSRQVIQLPMAAYANADSRAVRFKHLSAAINVMLWNATPMTLTIDKVAVSGPLAQIVLFALCPDRLVGIASKWDATAEQYLKAEYYDLPVLGQLYSINGSRTLDLTADDLGIVPVLGAGTADRTVTVSCQQDINPGDNTKCIQVPVTPFGNDQVTISVYCHNGSNYYFYTMTPDASNSLDRNRMLTARVKLDLNGHMNQAVNLSSINKAYTAKDGDILYGSTQYQVTIEDGATVTLHNASISRTNDGLGILCKGNATIILSDSNYVKGKGSNPGIQPGGTGTLLTIRGDGKLVAQGGTGAGIGVSTGKTCGHVTISGGTVDAKSQSNGPGIGAYNGTCGNIIISGGTVIATGVYAPGIGCRGTSTYPAECGDITITKNVVSVTAKCNNSSPKIGVESGTSHSSVGAIYFDNVQMHDGTSWLVTPVDNTNYGDLHLSVQTSNNTNDTWVLTPTN